MNTTRAQESFAENFRHADEIDVGFQHPDTGVDVRVVWERGKPAEAACRPQDGSEPDADTLELVEAIDGRTFPTGEALVRELLWRGVSPDDF